MSTTHAKQVAQWLAANPVPIHRAEVPAWSERVKIEVGDTAMPELLDLLAHGDLERQYQAVAAARALGAQVWAEGTEPELKWRIRLPHEISDRLVRPDVQLAD